LEVTASVKGLSNGLDQYSNGDEPYGIVVFSHLRWTFVWQRPQQFISRFAVRHPVLFVEEPIFDLQDGADPKLELTNVAQNITVACPHLSPTDTEESRQYPITRDLIKQAISVLNGSGEFDCPLLWYYSPMMAAWSLEYFRCRGVVYDCMDELSQFRGAPANLVKNEQRLLRAADIVFTGGFELWLKKQRHHENVHFFGCGVEYEHFAQAQDPTTPVPDDMRAVRRPVLGWFGVIDERMDYDLVARVARLRRDWSLALIGPVVKIDPAALPQAPNIHWMGQRDYTALPAYCKAFDVCIMPFAINEATEFINPTKALEYLATGKPVIATPVRDVIRQYTDTIYIAETPEEFVARAEEALQAPDKRRRRRGIERAKSCSWENTVEKMSQLINEAIKVEQASAL
jgi:glycosyltransferase involved in cell wall biosynthesis